RASPAAPSPRWRTIPSVTSPAGDGVRVAQPNKPLLVVGGLVRRHLRRGEPIGHVVACAILGKAILDVTDSVLYGAEISAWAVLGKVVVIVPEGAVVATNTLTKRTASLETPVIRMRRLGGVVQVVTRPP